MPYEEIDRVMLPNPVVNNMWIRSSYSILAAPFRPLISFLLFRRYARMPVAVAVS